MGRAQRRCRTRPATAHVIGSEISDAAEPFYGVGERLGIEDLGADVDVHTLEPKERVRLDARDGLGRLVERQPELGRIAPVA